ncbi:MAG: hypothetical protein H6834_16540 [Planctomycetes bacterium]|nr:hypothetical protein [Planctomycetota bacterium]
MRVSIARIVLFACLVAPCPGQDLQQARNDLRKRLRDIGFAQSLNGLVLASDELVFSGAHYRIKDGRNTITLTTLSIPFHTTLEAFGEGSPDLYVEGVVGYARADEDANDLWQGGFPGLETAVDTSFTTLSGLGGIGVSFEVAEDLTVVPIVNVGVAHLENTTDYGGPGASVTSALLDGLAFNWDTWILSTGTALRTEWKHALSEEHELTLLGRYDLRWSESVGYDDRAQQFTVRNQLATVRADVTGPTGFEMFGQELGWRVDLGYRWFLEGDLFGVHGYTQIGAALELDTEDVLPLGSQVSLGAAVMLGSNFWGWSLGVSISL